MTLVFGCRQSDTDHLYQAETLQLKRKGVLKDVYTAYSREPSQPKVREKHAQCFIRAEALLLHSDSQFKYRLETRGDKVHFLFSACLSVAWMTYAI